MEVGQLEGGVEAQLLDIGLGVGWSRDELDAVGVTGGVGARMDELVGVLERVWDADDVVEHRGHFASVAPSRVGLTPVQRPRPPLYFPAFSPAAMARVAHHGDGWLPAGLPLDAMTSMWTTIRQMTADAGRDPSALQLVVRANCFTVQHQPGSPRPLFQGDIGQLASDLRQCCDLGVDEVVLGLQFTEAGVSIDRFADTVTAATDAVADLRQDQLAATTA